MYPVGQIKRAAERLLEVTYEAMMRGIAAVRPGSAHRRHRPRDPGPMPKPSAARSCATSAATASGLLFHDAPNILHYGAPSEGVEMQPGMIFTDRADDQSRPAAREVLGDGWTAVTRDRSLSAQYEHTVGVTEDGCEIFTLSPAGLDRPGLPS